MLRPPLTYALAGFVLFALSKTVSSDTITVADGDGADAYVQSSDPDIPFGIDDELRIRVRSDGNQRKAYLRFDLGSLSFDNELTGSASLSLFGDVDDDINPNTLLLYGVNDGILGDGPNDWSEEEITFNEAPEVGFVGTEVGENTTWLSSLEFPEPPGGGRFVYGGGEELVLESTPDFVNFVRSDTNDLLTMILIYEDVSGSSFSFESKEDAIHRISTLTLTQQLTEPCDVNGDSLCDAADIDELATAIRNPPADLKYDLDLDGMVDLQDHQYWVVELMNTWTGDANLDLEFNSSDMVQVFVGGKYETNQHAGWAEGDWDGSGLFTSSDMVGAFVVGGYEEGQRPQAATVPEPTSLAMFIAGCIGTAICWRRVSCSRRY